MIARQRRREDGSLALRLPAGEHVIAGRTVVAEPTLEADAAEEGKAMRLAGEMWQVLDGPIDITVDDRAWSAAEGEIVWVPRGSTHRMGNSGSGPGRLLEVAFGHFDEGDIERLEDDYAR